MVRKFFSILILSSLLNPTEAMDMFGEMGGVFSFLRSMKDGTAEVTRAQEIHEGYKSELAKLFSDASAYLSEKKITSTPEEGKLVQAILDSIKGESIKLADELAGSMARFDRLKEIKASYDEGDVRPVASEFIELFSRIQKWGHLVKVCCGQLSFDAESVVKLSSTRSEKYSIPFDRSTKKMALSQELIMGLFADEKFMSGRLMGSTVHQDMIGKAYDSALQFSGVLRQTYTNLSKDKSPLTRMKGRSDLKTLMGMREGLEESVKELRKKLPKEGPAKKKKNKKKKTGTGNAQTVESPSSSVSSGANAPVLKTEPTPASPAQAELAVVPVPASPVKDRGSSSQGVRPAPVVEASAPAVQAVIVEHPAPLSREKSSGEANLTLIHPSNAYSTGKRAPLDRSVSVYGDGAFGQTPKAETREERLARINANRRSRQLQRTESGRFVDVAPVPQLEKGSSKRNLKTQEHTKEVQVYFSNTAVQKEYDQLKESWEKLDKIMKEIKENPYSVKGLGKPKKVTGPVKGLDGCYERRVGMKGKKDRFVYLPEKQADGSLKITIIQCSGHL